MDNKKTLISNLYIFSIVAKFLSFTLASEELCITQGAVSQRIKKLEEELGFKLFVRLTRRLELTDDGSRILSVLTQSLDNIFSEIEDIRFDELTGELYIGVAPTFAHLWLLPRLANFQQNYPSLNVKVRVKASKLDFQNQPVDLAIYYSNEVHKNFYYKRLLDEKLLPVCSPEYAKQLGLFQSDKRLNQAYFIHCTESLEFLSPHTEWKRWLEKTNRDMNVEEKYYVFNHEELAMSAARNSIGIAIGRYHLIKPYLDSGELVAPFPAVDADFGYDLICPKGHELKPRFQAFAQWIEAFIR